ncbi:lamin tail domain-containing protein [Streptomyces sp. NPDC051020]|uniref:lamin tail domain-containing protein n=1 Tax=Streptomyces sp. NPDC051020 TaxID=3155409 RepID=UPI0034411105
MSRSARRFAATVIAAGALVGAAALPAAADNDRGYGRSNSYSGVVLGEIQHDTSGPDNGTNRSLNDEWVTVTNTSYRTVDLSGWTLSDESRRTYRFDMRLAGRSSVRVHTGYGRDNRRDVYQNLRHYVWDNRDTATLRDEDGDRVDSKSWGRRYDGWWGHGRDEDNRRHRRYEDRDHDGWGHKDRDHDRWGHKDRDHDRWGHKDRDHDGRGHKDRDHDGWGHKDRDHDGWGHKDRDHDGWGHKDRDHDGRGHKDRDHDGRR